RIALVELNGRQPGTKNMRIVNMKSFKIDEKVRQRRGTDFFEWMAEKIEIALAEAPPQKVNDTESFPMGLAWSFPIEYVQLRSGNLLDMGKGFHATDALKALEITGAYGIHRQRLFCNVAVTSLRRPINTLRRHPGDWIQYFCAPARFVTCSDQVQRLPPEVARRSHACPREHRM
nr:hypothetical protein [Tanacetum cinerariifolium]